MRLRTRAPEIPGGLLDPAPVVLEAVPLRIDPAEVWAFWGYRGADDRPAGPPLDVAAALEAARAEIARVARPRACYQTVAVERAEPDRLTLAGARLHVPGIGRHWGSVEAVTVAFVTVGEGPEGLIRARREVGDEQGAAFLDSAASAAAECLAEWLNDALCARAVRAGVRTTNRISPGLAGWDLRAQRTLAALCPPAAIAVEVSAAGLMRPAKSISLLVGVGRTARVDHYFVQCRRCWLARCPARRAPAAASVHRDHRPEPRPS
ncbi:MAG: hypothetical protein ACREMB_24850 [Candidatus Rokuibacteriota bacterium]